jgi:type I restriction enzyme M protein
MFVQSARFVEEHRRRPSEEISVYGQESKAETVRLCKMNLAVHGLAGDIREANSYYQDPHSCLGRFDFVMANPPFNVNRVDKERLAGDKRFPFGLPNADSANYLWIQLFYSALSATGRAGFVMANSAADARASELAIRQKLIQSGAVDVVVSIGPNFFYTVTLPCTLWFLDNGKRGTDRGDKVLFLDARHIFRQMDRAHREFTSAQIEFLANTVRLYRGEKIQLARGSGTLFTEHFGGTPAAYTDRLGLCRVATIAEVEAQGWSLNPGRYVGVAPGEDDGPGFQERLERLYEEMGTLASEARQLERRISAAIVHVLGESG